MGCYDTVRFGCPKCGATVEQQSKADECCLRDYTLRDAPLTIIADLQRDGEASRLICESCSAHITIEVQRIAVAVVKLVSDEV